MFPHLWIVLKLSFQWFCLTWWPGWSWWVWEKSCCFWGSLVWLGAFEWGCRSQNTDLRAFKKKSAYLKNKIDDVRRWLISPLMPKQGVCFVEGKVNKSSFSKWHNFANELFFFPNKCMFPYLSELEKSKNGTTSNLLLYQCECPLKLSVCKR